MAQHSKIEQLLSRQELDELEAFAREPGREIDEIKQWLDERGFVVSRSSVGRWKQDFDQLLVAERMRGAGGLAKAFMEAARDGGGLQIADAAILQMAQLIFEKAASLPANGEAKIEDLNGMALSLQRLMLAKAREEKTRTEMQQRERLAIDEGTKVVAGGGDGKAVVNKMREILGIK